MEEVCSLNSGKQAKKRIIVSLISTAIVLLASAIGMLVYVHYNFLTLYGDSGNVYLYVTALAMALLYSYYNMYPITNVIIGKLFLFLLIIMVDVHENFALNLDDQQLEDHLKR